VREFDEFLEGSHRAAMNGATVQEVPTSREACLTSVRDFTHVKFYRRFLLRDVVEDEEGRFEEALQPRFADWLGRQGGWSPATGPKTPLPR